jgi:hypothetical protein
MALSLYRGPCRERSLVPFYQEILAMWFTSCFQSQKKGRGHARLRRAVPRLEILEDRTLPSTLTVLNNLDSQAGSLRDAITKAKDGDTIVFASSLNGQTITLTSDQLAINKSLNIEGPGAGLLAISGNDTNRVFAINEGFTVTIAGLTITHGRSRGGQTTAGGGGILNAGSTLNLSKDVFSDNVDLGSSENAQGGAVGNFHKDGILTVTDCTFIGNRADGTVNKGVFAEGGAIYNSKEGSSATVIRCTFMDNQAHAGSGTVATNTGNVESGEANGGALHNEGPSTLTVLDSTFIDNQAIGGSGGSAQKAAIFYVLDGGFGGAIADDDATGALVVSGCTFSHNQATGGSNSTGNASGQGVIGDGAGGALGIIGLATVTNCTFDHNAALGGSGNSSGGSLTVVGRGVGGAIQNTSFGSVQATLAVSGCTFTDNQAVGGSDNTGTPFVNEGFGGASDNIRGAAATITGSTFSGNQAIGGQGGTGQNGGSGLGGALTNVLGSTLTVSGCTFSANQAVGGAGGSGADGGNGFGGGVYNDGLSTITMLTSTITGNQAIGGSAGSGGSAGQGMGGGAYFAPGGTACLDLFTIPNITGNTASTSDNDIFGVFTIC